MTFATLLGDVMQSLFHRPITQQYPVEHLSTLDNFRGMLHYTPQGCTGCNLCVKDCPADAIEVITVDKAKKQYALRYHVDRCTFCGQCVENCRFDCIQLVSDQWELASVNREPFTVMYGEQSHVESSVAHNPAPEDHQPEKV